MAEMVPGALLVTSCTLSALHVQQQDACTVAACATHQAVNSAQTPADKSTLCNYTRCTS
jgi:hypothetical protein